jgi:hypothetical protein
MHKLLAEAMLDNAMLKEIAVKNGWPPRSYAERPWDELPECSGSIHRLRD